MKEVGLGKTVDMEAIEEGESKTKKNREECEFVAVVERMRIFESSNFEVEDEV